MSASLIARSGSSALRLSTTAVLMSPTGSRFVFGIGTKALPSWGSKTRWNNLWVGLVSVTAPSSREGHHTTARWSSSFLLSDLILMALAHIVEIVSGLDLPPLEHGAFLDRALDLAPVCHMRRGFHASIARTAAAL